MTTLRHFLRLSDYSVEELRSILARAGVLKKQKESGEVYQPFVGKVLAMLFEKASTRTRVSFESGFSQLGGSVIDLNPKDSHLITHETFEDTARVVSRMVDLIMVRTFEQKRLESFASASVVPVINGLTNEWHPCQIMGDLFTFKELRGSVQGCNVAWIGDANNVLYTWLEAADIFDFHINIYAPVGFKIDATRMPSTRCYDFFLTPEDAARGADLVTTDTWTSSGYDTRKEKNRPVSARWQVNEAIMEKAKSDALFMHCLPAHRGEEVTAEVIDGPQSAVWSEAANRLHVQKAIMEFLLCH